LSKFSDLGGTRVPGGTNPTEIDFLRAFALEQLGRTEDAVAAYLSIPDGRNEYYGRRATQRLLALGAQDKSRAIVQMRLNSFLNQAKAEQHEEARIAAQSALRLTNDPKTRTELLKRLQAAYEALPAYRFPQFDRMLAHVNRPLISELFVLKLYDEALPEYVAARGPVDPKSNEAYSIALLSLEAGLPNRAIRFAESLWKTMPADYVLELAPREMIELFYPVPYRDSLLKHATPRNVDPRFVLSIARQESRFHADAKSIAAARGMMQFIPATANQIAGELKLANFNQDDLYNADTAILFGSQYLANLFKLFPNQPQAVAGSYNGGEDNLARWIARSRAVEADRYVPEIGFSQTKDYVYKVLANYWNYQRLYDAQLNPIQQAGK
jgi:soluble lytic murein transglycosylase-like protein